MTAYLKMSNCDVHFIIQVSINENFTITYSLQSGGKKLKLNLSIENNDDISILMA